MAEKKAFVFDTNFIIQNQKFFETFWFSQTKKGTPPTGEVP